MRKPMGECQSMAICFEFCEVVIGSAGVKSLANFSMLQKSDVVFGSNTGHCNKDSSKFHASVVVVVEIQIENDTINCPSLSFVNSHGKCKVERKGLENLCGCNWCQNVGGCVSESVPV